MNLRYFLCSVQILLSVAFFHGNAQEDSSGLKIRPDFLQNLFPESAPNRLPIDYSLPKLSKEILSVKLDLPQIQYEKLVFSKPLNQFYWGEMRVNEWNPTVNADALTFSLQSQQHNFGFEGMNAVGGMINWKVSEKFSFSTGAFYASYFTDPMHYKPQQGVYFNAGAQYQVTNWLTLRSFGQYVPNPAQSAFPSIMAPDASFFGGGVRIKANDWLGFEAGAERIFHNGRWQTRPYAYPVIELFKKK